MDSTHHGAHLTPQPHPAFKLSKYAAALPFKVPFEAAMRQLSNSLDAHLLLQKKGGGRTGQGERRLLRGRKLSHQGQQNQEKTKNLDCKNFLRLDPKHTYCPNKKKRPGLEYVGMQVYVRGKRNVKVNESFLITCRYFTVNATHFFPKTSDQEQPGVSIPSLFRQ